ncbi:glycoside hydrolase family 2 protein [Catenovulum sediminis]|uniref:Glycoside hydrolase family 2 TIM barrel-domain containing protein n=1 Tax=Catenovulum sediminis TaxID=1740262 RepID=A0ABV1RLH7_9ALTE
MVNTIYRKQISVLLMTLVSFMLTACSGGGIGSFDSVGSTEHTAKTATRINNAVTQTRSHDFNFDWKFSQVATQNAFLPNYDDSQWKPVRLPHDWSIEADYTQQNTSGATGYLPAGKGWYRKSFSTPQAEVVQILFDGIYNHSKVWINGQLLGYRPYGYVPFHYDLTPYLYRDGRQNVLAVEVDRSRYVDSRWYTGSGIYRNVKLVTGSEVHIPIWGDYVTTPKITSEQAVVNLKTEIKNRKNLPQTVKILSQIYGPTGKLITSKLSDIHLQANQTATAERSLTVLHPQLWDIATPHLYTAKTDIYAGDKLLDSINTRFGIRYFKNNANTGFYLNGRNIKIKGVNLHHDAGLVGAAVPKGVWQRRLSKLKEAGVNAIRTAHNAPSKTFLELCDEMGFLVQNEIFDEWDNPKDKRKNFNQSGNGEHETQSYSHYFEKWAESDLKDTVKRDRNHASIFQWSIGNEIEWTYPRLTNATGYWAKDKPEDLNYYWSAPPRTPEQIKQALKAQPIKGKSLAQTAAKLAKWTREMDLTRPVTANLVTPSSSHLEGYTEVLDVIGYSYRQSVYEYGHNHYPDKMILGTENWVQWHEWQHVLEKDYIPGIFVWTGIDYLGEASGKWPRKGTNSGMLDFAAFEKPSFHMMKTLWNDEPHIYLTTKPMKESAYKLENGQVVEKVKGSWKKGKWYWREVNNHWNYQNNQLISVEAYTNFDAIELSLNGQSLGKQTLADNPDRILKWAVPYSAGTLTATAWKNGKRYSRQLKTASQPASIQLTTDKTELNADGYQVAHITAQLFDKNNNPVKHQDTIIQFKIPETLRLLGVDNGASDNIQRHLSTQIKTHNGRALLIVQSKFKKGETTVTALSDRIQSDAITLSLR